MAAPACRRGRRSSRTELGEIEIKARGYWEQVWIRFRRDKFAIAGGVTSSSSPVRRSSAPRSRRTPRPRAERQFFARRPRSRRRCCRSGRSSDVSQTTRDRPLHTFFILGADSTLGRDEFLRLLYGAQASLEVAHRARRIGAIVDRRR